MCFEFSKFYVAINTFTPYKVTGFTKHLTFNKKYSCYKVLYYSTVSTRPKPNLTEIRPQANPGSALCVHSGSAIVNPELTLSKPQADPEQTQNGYKKQTPIHNISTPKGYYD